MAKKALLIGINRYRITGADLRGCVNDVVRIKKMLIQYFGFTAKNIKTLTDLAASQKKMESGIEQLVTRAKPGDVLLLHYSGHGSNVPDDNGDEADNRDEILCPTDLDWYKPLRDDWLRKIFDKLPKKVNLTVIMDCCHSGSNTRLLAPPDALIIPRFLPCPLDLLAAESGRELTGTVRAVRNLTSFPAGPKKKADIVTFDMPETLVTGCRDTQTSADAFIDGSFNGALTYHLVRAIEEKKGKLTYRELHTITKSLLKGKYEQVPQLEGRNDMLDAPFLSPV